MGSSRPRHSTTRSRRRSARPNPRRVPARPRQPQPDLPAILDKFGDAIAVVNVARRSLESQELATTTQEEITLQAAIAALDAAYNELDIAIIQLERTNR